MTSAPTAPAPGVTPALPRAPLLRLPAWARRATDRPAPAATTHAAARTRGGRQAGHATRADGPVDPVALQLLLTALLALEVVVAALEGAPSATLPLGWQVTALVVLLLTAPLAPVLTRRRAVLLPVLDLVLAAALGPGGGHAGLAAGLAVTVPSLWLGLRLGGRGAGVALVTTLVTQAVFLPAGAASTDGWVVVLLTGAGATVVATTAALTRHHLDRALAEVEDQRRRTQNIIDSVDVGLLELDADGRYRAVNRQHEMFMAMAQPGGHPRAVGRRRSLFCADGVTPLPDDQVPTTRAMRGEQLADELCWVGADPATRRALAISSTPQRDPEGQLRGVVLAFKDVTDLISALRVKDEFVAAVSHELRTPLTSIVGYVDVVLEDLEEVPDEVRHLLGAVRRNSRRLRRLVDDLLSTAHASAANAAEVRPVPLDRLLATCTQEARRVAHEKGLTLELAVDPGPGSPDGPHPSEALVVDGDEERLGQVVDNLLGNAVKYTAAGGRVRAEVHAEGAEVVVRVVDTGRGIAAADLGEIFESFYRTQDVQRDAVPGVGLGLSITRRIVEAHGGRIGATSELGVGTTVEVRLPRAQASLPTNGVA